MARKRRSQKLVKRAESRAGHRASVQQISTTFAPMSAFPAATSSGAAFAVAHGSRRDMAGRRAVPCAPLVPPMAYDLFGCSGASGWVSSTNYDVVFTPDKAEAALGPDPALRSAKAVQSRNQQRLQAVLRDRFGLVLRAETHELPIFLLTQAKSGAKLTVHPADDSRRYLRNTDSGHRQMDTVGVTKKQLADTLSNIVGRPVNDGSDLTGQYDFKLDWTPDPGASPDHPDDTGPSIFSALTDQLGLSLKSTKGPVQVYVIEKIEHPSEN